MAHDVLEAARALMRRASRVFEPADRPVLIAAGQDKDFDPEHNALDAKIEAFLDASLGRPWRAHLNGHGETPLYTEDEARALGEAAAEVAALRLLYEQALDALILAESPVRTPPVVATIPQLQAIGRRYDAALRAFELAREALERASPKVTRIKLAAQDRRRREAQMAGAQ